MKKNKKIIMILIIIISLTITYFTVVSITKPRCTGPLCNLDPNSPFIEEHGKVAVAKLAFVEELVGEYGAQEVKISALGYQFIDDDAYIKGLLGGKYPNIDCIIPVKWPDGEVVYIEVINDGVEEYIQISAEEFENAIAGGSEEDIKILYDNMNDDQTYIRQITDTY